MQACFSGRTTCTAQLDSQVSALAYSMHLYAPHLCPVQATLIVLVVPLHDVTRQNKSATEANIMCPVRVSDLKCMLQTLCSQQSDVDLTEYRHLQFGLMTSTSSICISAQEIHFSRFAFFAFFECAHVTGLGPLSACLIQTLTIKLLPGLEHGKSRLMVLKLSDCIAVQPIRVQTGPGIVCSAVLHVIKEDANTEEMRVMAMHQWNPVHSFMFNSRGKLLNANKAALEACQNSVAGTCYMLHACRQPCAQHASALAALSACCYLLQTHSIHS